MLQSTMPWPPSLPHRGSVGRVHRFPNRRSRILRFSERNGVIHETQPADPSRPRAWACRPDRLRGPGASSCPVPRADLAAAGAVAAPGGDPRSVACADAGLDAAPPPRRGSRAPRPSDRPSSLDAPLRRARRVSRGLGARLRQRRPSLRCRPPDGAGAVAARCRAKTPIRAACRRARSARCAP